MLPFLNILHTYEMNDPLRKFNISELAEPETSNSP